jgi:uncharacterized SAM-binding protein YcdF (DUF218 family)
MIFYFGKIAVLMFGPLGIVILLLLIALIFFRRPLVGRIVLAAAIVILWAFSTHAVSQWLLRGLENQVPGYTVENAPMEPAIVVLGGFLHTPGGVHKRGELTEASDRLLQGFRLYRAGKAPLILISGGEVPMFGKGPETEAEAARSILEEWGVPEAAILVETRSKNTEENARFSRDVLGARGIHRALLVTSAAHMPRAVRAFRKAGLEVSPSPTDYQTGWPEPDLPFRFLPGPEALMNSANALKEYVGLFIYRLRGWA